MLGMFLFFAKIGWFFNNRTLNAVNGAFVNRL